MALVSTTRISGVRCSNLSGVFQSRAVSVHPLQRPRSTLAADSLYTETDYDKAKPFSEIPGPRGLPYLGTILEFRLGFHPIHEYHKKYAKRYARYGPIYKETRLGHTAVHLMDPEYVKLVYGMEGKSPYVPPLMDTVKMYRAKRNMSPGLGNTNGEDWVRMRSAVRQMMMRPKEVTQYLPGVNEIVRDFIARLKRMREPGSGEVPDFGNETLKWQLESSGYTCFETRLGSFESGPHDRPQRMIDANIVLFDNSRKLKFSLPLHKYLPWMPTWSGLLEAEDYFFGRGQDIVDETLLRIRDLTQSGRLREGQFAFMTYLLAQPTLSLKDVSIITLSLFSDGLSTTVPCMLGQIYMLAANPEKQQRLREEVDRVVPRDADVTARMINHMPYLKACVKEGFRFFPVGTEVSRITQQDMVLGGYQIPAGTILELNNNMLLRMSKFFKDPDVYKPERWIRGGPEEEVVHPYLLIPFGHGPRNCAGKRFAEQELHVMLAQMVQHFRLEWRHEQPMEQTYNVLLSPNVPPQISFTPRTQGDGGDD